MRRFGFPDPGRRGRAGRRCRLWRLLVPGRPLLSKAPTTPMSRGNVVAVTSRENATVLALHADNTQTVKRGQLLIEMDPAVANVNLQAAEANLARAVRSVRGEFSGADSYRAQLAPGARWRWPRRRTTISAARAASAGRGLGRGTGPCPRCGGGGRGRGQRGAGRPGTRRAPPSPAPTSPTIPMCWRRKRSCAPPPSPRPYAHRRAGGRRDRPAHRAGRPAGRGRHAADGGGAAVQCLDRRQFQGSAAGPTCASASR